MPSSRNRLHRAALSIVHSSLPGRLRLRAPDLYRREYLAQGLEARLKHWRGIKTARVNYYTSGIFVEFDPALLGAREIRRHISELIPELRRHRNWSYSGRHRREPRIKKRVPWHAIPLERVVRSRKTSLRHGLRSSEARQRLFRQGPNQLPVTAVRSHSELLREQLSNTPTILLLGAAAISVFTGGTAEAWLILGVVAVNTVVGYRTEGAAEESLHLLTERPHPEVCVIRDGRKRKILASEAVVGDVLVLQAGDVIAADARLFRSESLSMDESLLTGESFPVKKSVGEIEPKSLRGEVSLADRRNMVHCGTTVTGGNGLAVIVATGLYTEIGRVQELIGQAVHPKTSLQLRLEGLSAKLAAYSIALSAILFILEVIRGRGVIVSLKSAVSLAVAAMPESLPAVATTILAQGILRLKSLGVLVRRIGSIEDLGSVNLICLDKTGTLTQNRMKVAELRTAGNRLWRSGGDKATDSISESVSDSMARDLRELLEGRILLMVAAICNEAVDNQGSSTEKALLDLVAEAGMSVADLRNEHPLLGMRLRSEGRRFMSSLHSWGVEGKAGSKGMIVAVKGSPKEVLRRCNRYMKRGRVISLGQSTRKRILRDNEEMAGEALRVLGFAFCPLPLAAVSQSANSYEKNLVWLGLLGMSDPLRTEVHGLLGQLRSAGIKSVILTGDQAPTAAAIGRRLGIAEGAPLQIVESPDLAQMPSNELAETVQRAHVFARVSPAHKLQIVKAFQKAGHRVAMTGDGINDGPALKAAHIGIAMGAAGTDVARRVADVVLMKDDLSSIVSGIKEGRCIHQNVRKATDYIVAQNFAEILLIFSSVFLGWEEPLNPLQLLWVNLITDVFPQLAIAQEEAESDVLLQKPDNSQAELLDSANLRKVLLEGLVLGSSSLSSYLWGLKKYGKAREASTCAFLSINSASLLYTVAARSFRTTIFDRNRRQANPYVPMAVGVGFAAEFLGAFLPALRSVLGNSRIQSRDLLMTLFFSSLPLFGIELVKFVGSRLHQDSKTRRGFESVPRISLAEHELTLTDGVRARV